MCNVMLGKQQHDLQLNYSLYFKPLSVPLETITFVWFYILIRQSVFYLDLQIDSGKCNPTTGIQTVSCLYPAVRILAQDKKAPLLES